MGTAIALSALVDHYRRAATEGSPPPFKVAVYFCNPNSPFDINALRRGRFEFLNAAQTGGGIVKIPTAHIWGSADTYSQHGPVAKQFCRMDNHSVYVHNKGHDIPKTARETIEMANIIRRAIERAKSS